LHETASGGQEEQHGVLIVFMCYPFLFPIPYSLSWRRFSVFPKVS